jgi:hypothetical protein
VEEKEDIEEEEVKDVATASSVHPVVEEMEMVQEETELSEFQQEEPKRKEKRRDGLVQERIISVSVHYINPFSDTTFLTVLSKCEIRGSHCGDYEKIAILSEVRQCCLLDRY